MAYRRATKDRRCGLPLRHGRDCALGSSVDTPLATGLLPLSLSQREVWLDQRAWPGSTHLNIGGAGYVDGPFDLALLKAALACMVAENEAFSADG